VGTPGQRSPPRGLSAPGLNSRGQCANHGPIGQSPAVPINGDLELTRPLPPVCRSACNVRETAPARDRGDRSRVRGCASLAAYRSGWGTRVRVNRWSTWTSLRVVPSLRKADALAGCRNAHKTASPGTGVTRTAEFLTPNAQARLTTHRSPRLNPALDADPQPAPPTLATLLTSAALCCHCIPSAAP